MTSLQLSVFDNLQTYYGDIHNHCEISYGHGSLNDALYNAKLQLDFVSVTVHAVWPDLPTDDPELDYLVEYHEKGFERAKAGWGTYLSTMDANNTDDFVTFPSFEWHSMQYGDHCVYYLEDKNREIIDAPDLPTLRQILRDLDTPIFVLPHHIGYKQGYRGINWQAFTEELSPVAEIFSFHGLSEGGEGAYPYLHSMGPCHEHSTAQYGWSQGNIFGIVGSTDHHNAFPGSYGYGRLGVWADGLSRQSIWDAIKQRRTYALTGDRIQLAFALNDVVMGGIAPPSDTRKIQVAVKGGSALDYIDVLHNNRVIHRESIFSQSSDSNRFKVYIEMGWAERDTAFDWDVSLDIENGKLLDVEPRLRGYGPAVVAEDDNFAYSKLEHNDNHVRLQTHTRKNQSLHTANTEGLSLDIQGDANTVIRASINGHEEVLTLADLMTGTRTFYTGVFVSPVICFHRAIPETEFTHTFEFEHQQTSNTRDWYYIRVRQHNNQWAWSSPIWVEA